MSNKADLKKLMVRYDVTPFIVSDITGYSLSHINGMLSTKSVPKKALLAVANALKLKYPDK